MSERPPERRGRLHEPARTGQLAPQEENASRTERPATPAARSRTPRSVVERLGLVGREPLVELERPRRRQAAAAADRSSPRAAAGDRPGEVGRQHRLDQRVALVGRGQPPQREHVGERRRLRLQRQSRLGHDPGHAGVVERADQARRLGARPPHDDAEVAPRHVLLDVDPAQLARDRGVLLGAVQPVPRLDDGPAGALVPVRGLELDRRRRRGSPPRTRAADGRSFPGTRTRASRRRRRPPGSTDGARPGAGRSRRSPPGSRRPSRGRTAGRPRPRRSPPARPARRSRPRRGRTGRRGSGGRTRPARSSRRRSAAAAASSSSSGDRRASCARRRNCRTWSAKPSSGSIEPYAGQSRGSSPASSSRTRSYCSVAVSSCGAAS